MLPRLRNIPVVTNAVIGIAIGTTLVLLLGVPVERVLNVLDNPVSRVAVVTFGMSLVGILGLGFGVHLLLYRHKQMERELAQMRELVESTQASTDALAASSDELGSRVEVALQELQDEMATERERMRAQVRAYIKEGPTETRDHLSRTSRGVRFETTTPRDGTGGDDE